MKSHLAHFYMDGEAAFIDGFPVNENPYVKGDEAADAWEAGWMAAYTATANRTAEAGSFGLNA